MEYIETIPRSGYRLIQNDRHFRLCADSVFLSAFASYKNNSKICDLGCGGGAIMLLAAGWAATAKIDGVELLPSAVQLCQRNISENGLGDRLRVFEGDISHIKSVLDAGAYDLVISNPPYFAECSGAVSEKANTALARSDGLCSLASLCAAAAYLLKQGGRFATVYRCERLPQLITELKVVGLEPKRLRLICHTAASAPKVFLLEAVLGANPGLVVEPSLYVKGDDGRDSPEATKIYGMD